ncbi:ATP-grasp domain-containing protein [Bacillus sp. NPDC077027]|uniref:ATP-grasp domain-containing protein n=1 Tax=Bacillus sp. NPDC077027 TaxID=3390548 RepID=UPI003D060C39
MKNPTELFDFAGRKDVYWYGNINQEQNWEQTKAFPVFTDTVQNELVVQQEQQLLLAASSKDHVIFSHQPDPSFLCYLKEKGVTLPHIIRKEDAANQSGLLVPYLLDETIYDEPFARQKSIYGSNPVLVKHLNHKIFTRKWAEQNNFTVTRGAVCNHLTELKSTYDQLKMENFEKFVLKIPYGSSGKGLRIFKSDQEFNQILTFIKRRAESAELLLEGWHRTKRSLNAQLLIQEEGSYLLSVTEQLIDEDGVYMGTDFTPVYEEDRLLEYETCMKRLMDLLLKEGYRGIVGVDSIIDEKDELIPIIEMNARFTQVTYLLSTISRFLTKYSFLESRFKRFDCTAERAFEDILNELNQTLCPDEDGGFLIYTFGKTEAAGNWHYRVFILFYSVNQSKQSSMITTFEQFIFS